MEVTTSRKPAPPLRTFSKDLAFSLGGHYTPRGKAGIGEITEAFDSLLVFSKYGRDFLIEIFINGNLEYGFLSSSYSVSERTGEMVKGLVTNSRILYEKLSPYMNISISGDGNTDCDETDGTGTAGKKNQGVLTFDGAQKRRYVLRLKKVKFEDDAE